MKIKTKIKIHEMFRPLIIKGGNKNEN